MNHPYEFFWKTKSPFSNWHKVYFFVKGVQYNCVEQYMMARKAAVFQDWETHDLILKSEHPREQKALGRKVKNYDDRTWQYLSYEIVFYGCLQKFTQNGKMRLALEKTYDSILVEASPHDRIWGIGFAEENALENRSMWGENRLGKILTEIKTIIL